MFDGKLSLDQESLDPLEAKRTRNISRLRGSRAVSNHSLKKILSNVYSSCIIRMIRCVRLNRSFFFRTYTYFLTLKELQNLKEKGKETKNKRNDVQMLDNDGEESSGIQLGNRSTIDIVVAANFFVPRLNLVP